MKTSFLPLRHRTGLPLLALFLLLLLSPLLGAAQPSKDQGKPDAPAGAAQDSTTAEASSSSLGFPEPSGSTFTILGPAKACIGSTYTYGAVGDYGCTVSRWSVQGGTYTVSGSEVTVTWTSAQGRVQAIGGCPSGSGNTYLTTGELAVTAYQPPATAAAASRPEVCAGEAVTLTASGAASYAWSHGLGTAASVTVRPRATTTYTVTGTSNGCKTVASVTVRVNALPSAPPAPAISANTCGERTLTRSQPPYGVTWYWQGSNPNGFSTSNHSQVYPVYYTGTYYLRARSDAGCWGPSVAVYVGVKPLPTMSIPSLSTNACGDKVLTMGPPREGVSMYWQGTDPNSESTENWDTDYVVRESGTYYLRARDNSTGCWGKAAAIPVTVNKIPATPTPPSVSTNACGDKVLTRGTPPAGVTWYWQGRNSTGQSETNSAQTFAAAYSGTYYLRARGEGGCWSPVVAVEVEVKRFPYVPVVDPVFRFGAGPVGLQVRHTPEGESYRWYASPSGGTALHTGAVYTPAVSATATFYVEAVSAQGCVSGRRAVTATVSPVPVVTVTSGSAMLAPGGQVTLSVQAVYSGYQWLKDGVALSGKTGSTLAGVREPGAYSVRVTASHASGPKTATAEPVSVRRGRDAVDMNYIVENTVVDKGISDPARVDYLPVGSISQQVTYFDGLGRHVQTVQTQASPEGHDIVTPVIYDDFGRVEKSYLPYVKGQDGAYRPQAVSEQLAFYAPGPAADPLIATSTRPYAVSMFDGSPLNRVVKQGAPGDAWQPDGLPARTSTDHTIKSVLRANSTNEVRLWCYDPGTGDFTSSGFYSAHRLYVTETRDEHGALTVAYKDLQGRVVAKKVQESDNVTDSKSEAGFMVTQYVYDAPGNLRLVIQPEGVRRLPAPDAVTGKVTLGKESAFIANWCFRYGYDDRRRLARKQVPGSGEVLVAYSKRGLPVLTQDAVQKGRSEWSFTKYDALARPVMSGVVVMDKNLETVQGELDLETVHFERDNLSDAEVGYTLDNAYPRGITDRDVLTVTYYDTYDYLPIKDGAYAFTGDASKRASSVRGQLTGTRTRRMEGLTKGAWLTAVNYYDREYRPIESVSDSHLGNVDRMATTYRDDLSGLVEQTLLTHREGEAARAVLTSFTYDHAGRLLTTEQSIDGRSAVLLSSNAYNELGQLVDKGLHLEGGAGPLQSVDYRYNVRGWLTSINNASLTEDASNDEGGDVFGMELTYDSPTALSYRNGENGTSAAEGFFNGNISEMVWKSSGDNVQRAYSYGYDRANRLTTANYHTQGTGGDDYRMWGVGYDANGNIKSMNRAGLSSEEGEEKIYGQIDALSYTYLPERGNLLLGVDDNKATAATHDFEDKAGNKYSASSPEYTYDANGNMTGDANKGITKVAYNLLNLPFRIEFDGGANWIEYTYSASGEKLQKRVSENGTVTATDYAAGFVYEQGEVVFAFTPEGRALYMPDTKEGWRYEYHLRDHLGNLRVSFAEPVTVKAELTMEPMLASVEEEEFDRVEETRHRDMMRSRTGSHAALLSAVRGKPLGPSKRVALHKGDTLRAEAFGLYETERKKDLVFSLASWLASSAVVSATAGAPGEQGKGGKSKVLPFLGAGLAVAPQVLQKERGAPKAYIRYIVYDADSNYVESGYRTLSAQANRGWEKVELEYAVEQDGFAEVYLANESNEEAWFDDMSVSVSQGMLVQENHYDPWGLNLVGIEKQGNLDHKFQYNGKERQTELGLNWMDYGARMYDAQLGRFHTQDRFAEKYMPLTPYHYGANNPVSFIDINGDSIIHTNRFKENEFWMKVYDEWSKTKAGKRFIKDYGEGGKFENVAVTFDVAELYWHAGETRAYSYDPETGDKKEIVAEEDQRGQGAISSLREGDELKFKITLNWDRLDAKDLKSSPQSIFSRKNIINKGLTTLHEVQHVRTGHSSLMNGNKMMGSRQQHLLMKSSVSSSFLERLQYLREVLNPVQLVDPNYLKQKANEFDN